MACDVKALGQVVVVDTQGAPVRLGTLWAERPHVLLFLRHFG